MTLVGGVLNPGSAAAGTVTNTGGALTLNAVVLGNGGNDTKVSTGITTNGASELDLGVAGGAVGVLGLKGSTGGTATLTADATAANVTINANFIPSGAIVLGSAGARWGVFATAINASSTVTFGGLTNGSIGRIWMGANAVTISSGFGTSPTIVSSNGTASTQINVGTGGAASSGVLTMGVTAANGWIAYVNNRTAAAGHRADNTRHTASTTTTITVENQTTSTGAAVAWTASDVIDIIAFAY